MNDIVYSARMCLLLKRTTHALLGQCVESRTSDTSFLSPQAYYGDGPEGTISVIGTSFKSENFPIQVKQRGTLYPSWDLKFDFASRPQVENKFFGILGGVKSDP